MILNCTTSHAKIKYGALHPTPNVATVSWATRHQIKYFGSPSALLRLPPWGLPWVCSLSFTLPQIHAARISLSFCHVFKLDDSPAKKTSIRICFFERPTWRGRNDLFIFSLSLSLWFTLAITLKRICYITQQVCVISFLHWEFPLFLRTSLGLVCMALPLLALFPSRLLTHTHSVWQWIAVL